MESRLGLFLLMPLLAIGGTGCALFRHDKAVDSTPVSAPVATDAQGPTTSAVTEPVIDPKVERRVIKTPSIKSSNFEIGAYGGIISIEDFQSKAITGVRLSYHVTPRFFLEGNYGMSKGGESSAETLGQFKLLTDNQRKYSHYGVSVGWNALPGQAFISENRAYNTNLYVVLGAGATRFADDTRFTVNGGFGYQVLFNNWISTHIDIRDYIHDSDVLGSKKMVNNIEATIGLSFYF